MLDLYKNVLQCKAGEVIFMHNNVPPYVVMVKDRPELVAFYGRLKDKVFPDGPSQNWAARCWDPKKHLHET